MLILGAERYERGLRPVAIRDIGLTNWATNWSDQSSATIMASSKPPPTTIDTVFETILADIVRERRSGARGNPAAKRTRKLAATAVEP